MFSRATAAWIRRTLVVSLVVATGIIGLAAEREPDGEPIAALLGGDAVSLVGEDSTIGRRTSTTTPSTTSAPTSSTTVAPTTTTTTMPDLSTPQGRGAAALAMIDYPIGATGFSVVFEPARDGYLGLTVRDTRTIHVYVRDHHTPHDLARITAHELGHAVDHAFLTWEQRVEYGRMRGVEGIFYWYPCDGCRDAGSLAGDFAEVFELWLLGPGDFGSEIAPPPDPARLRDLERFFRPS